MANSLPEAPPMSQPRPRHNIAWTEPEPTIYRGKMRHLDVDKDIELRYNSIWVARQVTSQFGLSL